MPITWKNVNGSSGVGEGAWVMQGASRNINQGMNELRSLLQERQGIQRDNFQNDRRNNTNTFLDRLAEFGSSDDLTAAQESGDINTLRQQLGPNVDSTILRNAPMERLNALQAQESAGRARDMDALRGSLAPTVEGLMTDVFRGDGERALAAMEQDPELRENLLRTGQYKDLYEAFDRRSQTQKNRDWADEDRDLIRAKREREDEGRAAAEAVRDLGARFAAEAGNGALGTDTMLAREVLQEALAIPGAGPGLINQLKESMGFAQGNRNFIAPADAAAIAQEDALINESWATNTFAQTEQIPPESQLNTLIDEMAKQDGRDLGGLKRQVRNVILEALSGNIKLPGASGDQDTFRFTPDQVRNIIKTKFGRRMTFEENALRDELRDYAGKPEYQQSWNTYEEGKNWRSYSDEEKLQALGEREARNRNASMGQANPVDDIMRSVSQAPQETPAEQSRKPKRGTTDRQPGESYLPSQGNRQIGSVDEYAAFGDRLGSTVDGLARDTWERLTLPGRLVESGGRAVAERVEGVVADEAVKRDMREAINIAKEGKRNGFRNISDQALARAVESRAVSDEARAILQTELLSRFQRRSS